MKGRLEVLLSTWVPFVLLTLLVSKTVAAHPEPELITVHSTNSWIRYAPETACEGDIFGGCGRRYDPWEIKTYSSHDGQLHSFQQANNWANRPNSDLARRWAYTFTGTAIYIYAPPREHLGFKPGAQAVCLDGFCRSIDVDSLYDNTPVPERPLLIWSKENLAPRTHVVEMTLLDSGPTRKWPWDHAWSAMNFEFLQYRPISAAPLKYQLREYEEGIDIELYDTNFGIDYYPSTTTYGCCTTYTPWDKIYTATSGVSDTFHHTSNWGNEASGVLRRRLKFDIQRATSLSIWGAPKAELEKYFWPYQHGRTELCLNNACVGLDSYQAYLNVPREKDHLPVLLWSTETLQPATSYAVSIKLLDLTHPLKDHITRMTLQKVLYTEVQNKSPHPIPGAHYAIHRTDARATTYGPCWFWCLFGNPWSLAPSVLGGGFIMADDTTGWWDSFPGWDWDAPFGTYEIKVFGAPWSALEREKHAAQEICIGYECRNIDTEHIYMKIPFEERRNPVLLYHATNLDFRRKQYVRVQAVKKSDDPVRKVLTLAKVEYKTVTLPRPTPPPGFDDGAVIAIIIISAILGTFGLGAVVVWIAIALANYRTNIKPINERTPLLYETWPAPVYVPPTPVGVRPITHENCTRPQMTVPAAPPRNLNRSGGARSPPSYPYTEIRSTPPPYPGY